MKNQSNKFKFFKVKQKVFKGFCLLITTYYITALIVNSTHISLCERKTIIGRRDGKKSLHFYTSVLKY